MTDSNTWKFDESEVEERWRRVLPKPTVWQFSLQKLLVYIAGFAVVFWLFGWEIRLARQDSRIVQNLNQFGPNCVYERGSTIFGSLSERVSALSFKFGNKLGNDDLVELKGLTGLRSLNVAGSQITDAGLEHIKGLSNLFDLDLSNTQITDAGLVQLKGLTKLTWLKLSSTQITDAGVEHLQDLSKLRSLDLKNVQITLEGQMKLQQALPNCWITR